MTTEAVEKRPMEEGKVYMYGTEEWQLFPPVENTVVEFEARGSEAEDAELVWCAMLFTKVQERESGDVFCEGRFLGAENEYAQKKYANLINRRGQVVHFCKKSPCDVGDEGVAAHSLRGRWWYPNKYEGSFLKAWGSAVLKEFIETGDIKTRRIDPEKEGGLPEKPLTGKPKRRREGGDPTPKSGPGLGRGGGARRRKPAKPDPEEKDLGQVAALRDRLKGLRRRMDGIAPEGDKEVVDVASSGEDGYPPEESFSALVASGLNTGDQMNPWNSHLGYGHPMVKCEDTKDGILNKRRKRKSLAAAALEKKRTTSQLLAIAEQREVVSKEDQRRKKKRKKGGSEKAKAVVRLLRGKKRKKKDEDPSDNGSSSDEETSSGDSSTESDPLAPLLKKSLKSPGRVLRMLVEHATQVLDQSSLVETSDANPVTGGVKMARYFNLLIRPYHATSSRDMKELHHLAICLDELRSGRLGALGDSLASRLAIHSAVNEGGWKAAQFLELHPLEPTQSAPTSLLLQARKHAHVVAKSQGDGGPSRWQKPGGQGWQKGDYTEKGKGKGGKGKGQKGRGWKGDQSSWWQGGNQWSDKTSWWDKEKDKKTKEKEDAKKAEK